MAWTTSAGLCVQTIARRYAATQLRTATSVVTATRRACSRAHPGFVCALPLAALGFATPLLPPALTASILLAGGFVLILFAIRKPVHASRGHWAFPPGIDVPAVASPKSQAQAQIPMHAVPQRSPRIVSDQKERAWADLMSRINHDLRTPLNAVIGFSELMVLEIFGPLNDRRYQDYAQHIRDSAGELLKSAEDTIALTALMAGPVKGRRAAVTCGLQQIAEEAWTFLARKAASRDLTFESAFLPDLEVMSEPRVLRQILINLLSEAIVRAAHGERVILIADADGELVELAVSVSRERPRAAQREGSLPICLARALLEMQGTGLMELDGPTHGWRAVTVLDRAAQPDFFVECENEIVESRQRIGMMSAFG